jgi:hypothetical protein
VKEEEMNEEVIATLHTEGDETLADGDQLIVRREEEGVVARPVPEIDSDEPIHSFRELAAAHRVNAARKLRRRR